VPERPKVARVAVGAVVDRVSLGIEADGPETADAARHMHGGGDEKPALAGLRPDHCACEQRVLAGVARAVLHDEALRLDAGEAEKRVRRVGLGAAVAGEKAAVAARENETGAGVLLGEIDGDGQARGGLVEGDLPARKADGAAEHDDAVDAAVV
jgi:hypothetical protein